MRPQHITHIALLVILLGVGTVDAKGKATSAIRTERKQMRRQQRVERTAERKEQKAVKRELKTEIKAVASQQHTVEQAQKQLRKADTSQLRTARKELAQELRSEAVVMRREQRDQRSERKDLVREQRTDARAEHKEDRQAAKEFRREARRPAVIHDSDSSTSTNVDVGVKVGDVVDVQASVEVASEPVILRQASRQQRREWQGVARRDRVDLRREQRSEKKQLKRDRREVAADGRGEAKTLKRENRNDRKVARGEYRGLAKAQRVVRAIERKTDKAQKKEVTDRLRQAQARAGRSDVVRARGDREQRGRHRDGDRHYSRSSNRDGDGHGRYYDRLYNRYDRPVRTHYARHHRWERRNYRHYRKHRSRAVIHVFGIWDYTPCYVYPLIRTVSVFEPLDRVIVAGGVTITEPLVTVRSEREVWSSLHEKLLVQTLIGSAPEREDAVRQLAAFDSVASVAVLIDAMINDAEPQVRAAAAASLGTIGDPLAYEALLRSAAAEHDETVRSAAFASAEIMEQLYDLERPDMLTFPPMNSGKRSLGEYLEDLRLGEAKAREKAAAELEDHAGTQAVVALLDALINDPDDDVREAAAEALGEIGDGMAIDFLREAMRTDVEDDVRDEAQKAIYRIEEELLRNSGARRFG